MVGCAARAMANPPTPNPAMIPYTGNPNRSAPEASIAAATIIPSKRVKARMRCASMPLGAMCGEAMTASAITGAKRHEIHAPARY